MKRVFLIILALLLVGCAKPPPTVSDIKVVNQSQPGEPLELAPHLVKDKTTLVEYYSDHCGPCKEMIPVMEFLAAHRSDLAIRKVDIDRKGVSVIDFDSPLAKQHDIHAVPCFKIYDPSGKLVASDRAAKDQVRTWYNDAQRAATARTSSEGIK